MLVLEAGYGTVGLGRGRLPIRCHFELFVADCDRHRFRVELGPPDRNYVVSPDGALRPTT